MALSTFEEENRRVMMEDVCVIENVLSAVKTAWPIRDEWDEMKRPHEKDGVVAPIVEIWYNKVHVCTAYPFSYEWYVPDETRKMICSKNEIRAASCSSVKMEGNSKDLWDVYQVIVTVCGRLDRKRRL